jgi:hypothetical protein
MGAKVSKTKKEKEISFENIEKVLIGKRAKRVQR